MKNENKQQNIIIKEWFNYIIAELSLFIFLYYVKYLLSVNNNLWISSLILLILLNISIGLCPLIKKCKK